MPQPIVRLIARRAVQVAIVAAGIMVALLAFSRPAHAATAPPVPTGPLSSATSPLTSATGPVTSAIGSVTSAVTGTTTSSATTATLSLIHI